MDITKNMVEDVVSFKLHNVKLVDESELPMLKDLSKTFNSISRCAFKRFKSIGLNGMLKFHKKPEQRPSRGKFKPCKFRDGRPIGYEAPDGMSDEMWLKMRQESYWNKRNKALANANPFWQIDKDLGSPISGTVKLMGEWAKNNGYDIDSVLLHNAVMQGFKNYKSFMRQKGMWQTDKDSPAFGEMKLRSRKKLNKEEFQVTRNAAISVVGKEKQGNPKFKFDLESNKMTFTFQRRRIEFDFSSHRFSKKGYKTFSDIVHGMDNGNLAVTITLKRLENGKFNVTLTYSPMKLKRMEKVNEETRRCAIYATDEAICQTIVDENGKQLFSRTWRMDKLVNERHCLDMAEQSKWKGNLKDHAMWIRKVSRRLETRTGDVLEKVFNICRSYGVGKVVVETPRSRTRKNFNHAYIEFNKEKICSGDVQPCVMSAPRFVERVRTRCIRNGMKFKKVNGTFVQLKAILESKSMDDALRNACASLIDLEDAGKRQGFRPTNWAKHLQDPSMLDWVKHLLHNKRGRQARSEVHKAFNNRAVEKAVRLIDIRNKFHRS